MTTMFLFVIAFTFLGGVFVGRQFTVRAFVAELGLYDPNEEG